MVVQLLAVAAVVTAAAAILRVLAVQKKLQTLTQSYWDLRYDFGRLRARIAKLDGGSDGGEERDSGEPGKRGSGKAGEQGSGAEA